MFSSLYLSLKWLAILGITNIICAVVTCSLMNDDPIFKTIEQFLKSKRLWIKCLSDSPKEDAK